MSHCFLASRERDKHNKAFAREISEKGARVYEEVWYTFLKIPKFYPKIPGNKNRCYSQGEFMGFAEWMG